MSFLSGLNLFANYKKIKKMKFNTKTIHGGQKPEEATGSVMPPVFLTSTFAQSSPGNHKGYAYGRGTNPTRTALENSFAAIENGTHGFAFASGMAAIDCATGRWTLLTLTSDLS